MMKTAAVALCVALCASAAFAAQPDGDVKKGKRVFNRCKACHTIEEGGANKIGPNQWKLFGRVAGTHEGFNYSDVMVKAGEDGLVWNADTLAQFLTDPKGFLPNNRMAFAGLRKEEQVRDLIAYLYEATGGE